MSARLDGSIALGDKVLIHWPGSVDHGRTATVVGGSGELATVEIGRTSVGMPTSRLIVIDAVGYCHSHQARRCTICAPSPPSVDPYGVREFRDDEAGYSAWLTAHPDGFVINIARHFNATTARMHYAGCRTVSGQNPHVGNWTGPYVKVCAEHRAELDQWALNQVGEPIRRCRTCHAANEAAQSSSITSTASIKAAASTKTTAPKPTAAAVPEGRCEIRGSAAGSSLVEAWADEYIRFEHRPPWQEKLRTDIRSSCQQLLPSAEQVLHATFFGPKLPNADVENLALYNIDTFRVAGRNGIRFEHGGAVPPGPDGAAYRFGYRYALAPRPGTFAEWHPVRTLASFDWTDLGTFAAEKRLAQVWLALSRGEPKVSEPASRATPFAVRVQMRPPKGHQSVWGGLVKGVFDGVICAFQTHTDTTVLPEVVARLQTVLPVAPAEIEHHLVDQSRAVLGPTPRLAAPYGNGVKWNPSDHLCVAGELLPTEPVDDRWAIKGEIFELSR